MSYEKKHKKLFVTWEALCSIGYSDSNTYAFAIRLCGPELCNVKCSALGSFFQACFHLGGCFAKTQHSPTRFAIWVCDSYAFLCSRGCDLEKWAAEMQRLIMHSSGSRFDRRPQRLTIFHLILGERRESLARTPDSPYFGSGSLGNCSGRSFCPDQVLLSKNFRSKPGCRQKSLVRKSGDRILNSGCLLKKSPKADMAKKARRQVYWILLLSIFAASAMRLQPPKVGLSLIQATPQDLVWFMLGQIYSRT